MASIIEESKKAKQTGLLGFWRNKKIVYLIIFILLVGGGSYFFLNKKEENVVEKTIKQWIVKQDDIMVSVEADGKVVAKDGVELSFSVSGDNLEVSEVFVNEGDKINKGDKIASVNSDTLDLSLRSAWSSYQSTLADYNETMAGATDDEISDAQDKITSAILSLEQAKDSLESTKTNVEDNIYNAQKKLDEAKEAWEDNINVEDSEQVKDAYESLVEFIKSTNISIESILKKSDEILGVDQKNLNDDYENLLGVKDSSTKTDALKSYNKAKEDSIELNKQAVTINFSSSYYMIDEALKQTILTLESFEDHLYDMKLMLDATVTSIDFSQSSLDSLINSISSNRTSINSKITTLNSKENEINDTIDSLDDYETEYEEALRDLETTKQDGERSIKNAEANVTTKEMSLEQAERSLEELKEPLSESELASARSRLTSSSISLEKAQNELDKAVLVSPIDGQIVELNYDAGDIITDNSKTVATIINNDTLFIEVDIEEADIAKLKIGQKAYATFDALDELKLEGEISFISLTSETNNNGIVTYLVRVLFSKGENEIREGMSAYIDFVTSEANDVLVVPVSAVRNVSGKPSVQTEIGDWVTVITGFTDGKYVEVISGLSAGDKIIY